MAWRPDPKAPYQLMRWTPGAGDLKPAIVEQRAHARNHRFRRFRFDLISFDEALHDF